MTAALVRREVHFVAILSPAFRERRGFQDPPGGGQARTDFALIESNLEFIAGQLAKQPTRGDLARAALGIIFCTAVFTTMFVWVVWH